jgi:hypothetical protein
MRPSRDSDLDRRFINTASDFVSACPLTASAVEGNPHKSPLTPIGVKITAADHRRRSWVHRTRGRDMSRPYTKRRRPEGRGKVMPVAKAYRERRR